MVALKAGQTAMRDRDQTTVAGLTARLEENCSGLICHLDTPRMGCYLVPVWRFPRPSRSIHFGDVSQAKWPPRDPKCIGRVE